tara:strand:+ start:227 stop:496 length:270 start_codon:yes stop_codon:yes gene_type:complete
MINLVEHKWIYKEHKCFIHVEVEYDGDTAKAYHDVVKPDGTKILAPLDVADTTRSLVEDWIDLGCPRRIGSAPLNKWDIKLLKSVGGTA